MKSSPKQYLTAAELLARLRRDRDPLVRQWAGKFLEQEVVTVEQCQEAERNRQMEIEKRRVSQQEEEQRKRDELYESEREQERKQRERNRTLAVSRLRKLARKTTRSDKR